MEKVFDFKKPEKKGGGKTTITLTRDMPFYNVCPVFGYNDCMVAKLSYVPSDKVIENSVFRTFFDRQFNQKVESIAVECFDYINKLINPEKNDRGNFACKRNE